MITNDPTHPDLGHGADEVPGPQNKVYLALSESERKKGFVRPFRDAYRHVGLKPKNPLRDLTEEEHKQYDQFGYLKFEKYPDSELPVTGRFWTQKDLDNTGCGTITTMHRDLAETYARDPKFYGSTYCCKCRLHRPVQEFTWYEMDGTEGPVVGT